MTDSQADKPINVANYCACFIDLLGQRKALEGQGLITESQPREDFLETVRNSVGVIEALQIQAEGFRQPNLRTFSRREELSADNKKLYDQMRQAVARQQRWSDGLVYYTSLARSVSPCPMNAILEIFMLAGTLCFLGLTNRQPIRGAIEVSWGVELHENELYGAVIANSYKLESEIAQYPRIVIGGRTINYLEAHVREEVLAEDKLGLFNKNCAQLCLNMTKVDQDGWRFIDYLGDEFTNSVTRSLSPELFRSAYSFVVDQYDEHNKSGNTKLAQRYVWLKSYFDKSGLADE